MEATVAERGQITLPKAVRDALGLTKGTQLKVELERQLDHPAQERRRRALAPARQVQAAAGRRAPTTSCASCAAARPATRSTREPMIAVDSSVLIDLLGDDVSRRCGRGVRPPGAGARAGRRLRRRRRRGGRRARLRRRAVRRARGGRHPLLAFRGASRGARRRDAAALQGAPARPKAAPERSPRAVPDFLIGAHALLQCSGLITRDAGFFRDYFKGLKVIVPKAGLTLAIEHPPGNDHAPRLRHHAADLQDRAPARPAASTRCPSSPKTYPERRPPAGLDAHRARVGAAQLRRQEGHARARRRGRQLAGRTRRAPTRSRSSSPASSCRTSPACRCWPTWRRCAPSPTTMGKDPKTIEPLVPVDLVVDHSVMIDYFGTQGRARPQHEARVPAQPRALPVHEVGHAGVRHLRRRAAGLRHRPPGQPRVPRARRAQGRGAGRGARRSTTPTRWSAPTATRR